MDEAGQAESALISATQAGLVAMTGMPIPPPLQKGFGKALSRLLGAAIDIPASKLESYSDEIRATTEARKAVIAGAGQKVAAGLRSIDDVAVRAQARFTSKILREQVNVEDILKIAGKDLTKAKPTSEPDDIKPDWWNTFESEAAQKSSEEMKEVFGRLLSGEIQQPGSFSLKAIKTIASLDKEAVELFVRACSMSGDFVAGRRVLSFGGSASQNALDKYGLNFYQLNTLEEHGLINADFDCQLPVKQFAVLKAPIEHGGISYVLVASDQVSETARVRGIQFSRVGNELAKIVDRVAMPAYTVEWKKHFTDMGFSLLPVAI